MKISSKRIDIFLAENSMTKKELAEASGISQQGLCNILSRSSCLPLTAGKIARAMGVDVTELLEVKNT